MKRKILAGMIVAAAIAMTPATSPGCGYADSPTQVSETLEMNFSAGQMAKWETETEAEAAKATGLEGHIDAFLKYTTQHGFEVPINRRIGLQAHGLALEGEPNIQIEAKPLRGLVPVKNATQYADYELETIVHELNHAAALISSPRGMIFAQFGRNGLDARRTVVGNSEVVLIAKRGITGTVQANTFGGKIYWQNDVSHDLALSILESYANSAMGIAGEDAYLKAEDELSVKLMQAWNTKLASWMVTEAQAYFAMPLTDHADRQTLEESVLTLLPANEPQHASKAKEAISDVISGYASLYKAGIEGAEADLIMAEVAGKSMVLSDDKFAPYTQLRKNIAMLVSQYGMPSQAEIDYALAKRLRSNNERHGLIRGTVNRQVEKLVNKPLQDFIFEQNPNGSYTLHAN